MWLELDTQRSIPQDLSKLLLFLFEKVYDSQENEGGSWSGTQKKEF